MHKLLNLVLAGSASVILMVPALGQGQPGGQYWQQPQQQSQPYYPQNGYAPQQLQQPQQSMYYGNVSSANQLQRQGQPGGNYVSGQMPPQPLLNSSRSDSGSQYSPFQGAAPEVAKKAGLLSGVGHLIGNTARVAVPLAAGAMMMKASTNMMMQNGAMGRNGLGTAVQPSMVGGPPGAYYASTPMVYPNYNPAAAMMAPMMMGAGMSMMMNAGR